MEGIEMKFDKQFKMTLVLILTMVLALGCGAKTGQVENENSTGNKGETVSSSKNAFTWGSSSLGSQGYVIIEALASTANKFVDFKNSSLSTAGGAENMVLIEQKEIDFGQATSSDLFNAYHGQKPYDKKLEFAQVFAYGYWSLPILVLEDSKIQTVEDLKGKKLSVGTAGGASASIIKQVLDEYGIGNDVEYVYLNSKESANALGQGQVDAVALWHMAGKLAHSSLQELALTNKFRPIKFNEEILNRLSKENEGIQITVTSKDAFDFYKEDTIAPGITGMLVTRPDQDEEKVYQLVKALYEHSDEVQKIGPELGYFKLDYAVKGLVPNYPVHPGAARYFKEVGIWKDNMVISHQ
jgi:TRAP transporter TAXI family solute receptor